MREKWRNVITISILLFVIFFGFPEHSRGQQPVTLVSNLRNPFALTFDNNNLYWIGYFFAPNNTTIITISKVPLNGGTPTDIVIQNFGTILNPTAIAVDNTSVYWSVNPGFGSGFIYKAPITGGTPTFLAGANQPAIIAVDSSYLYWVEANSGTPSLTGVRKIPVNGGDTLTLTTVGNQYEAMDLDTTHVYYSYLPTVPFGNLQFSIAKILKVGGDVIDLAPYIAGRPSSLAVDGSYVYWIEGDTGTLQKVSKNGGVVTPLASGLSQPMRVAVDATHVYWTEIAGGAAGAGTVKSVPLAGGAVTTLAGSLNSPFAIAADGAAVYWTELGTNGTDGAIKKIGFAIPCTVTSVAVDTNDNCNNTINTNCTPNIVLADGVESTDVTTMVNPAQAVNVDLSTTFGNVADARTDFRGIAISSYTSGVMTLGSTDTMTGTLSATICGQAFPNLERIFNYRGFNFHKSQVTDQTFTNANAIGIDTIQAFFEAHGSFLAKFMLVGRIGGFIDTNGNGKVDRGEPTYSAEGVSIPINASGTSAATIFFRSATGQVINPKILMATVEKENSLISLSTLPSSAVLNFAMGCDSPSNFVDQIQCAAKTLAHRFSDTTAFGRAITYPFFFHSTDGIQHAITGLGRQPVGFAIMTAATYAQYRYTPFIQSLQNGGGVYLFEKIWTNFGF